VTQNLSLIFQIRDFRLWTNPYTETTLSFAGLAKIAPWWLARRDYFLAKVPVPIAIGIESAGCATNAFCSYPLAVIKNALCDMSIFGYPHYF
jgi:hypothetical protein